MYSKQHKQQKQEKTTLDLINESNKKLANTIQINNETNLQLYQQEQQIDKITDKNKNIEKGLKKANFLFRGLSSFKGKVKNWWKGAPEEEAKQPQQQQQLQNFQKPKVYQVNHQNQEKQTKHQQEKQQKHKIAHKDKMKNFFDQLDKEDEALDDTLKMTEQLLQQTKEQQNMIRRQNKKLGNLNDDIEKNSHTMGKLNKKMDKY